jgi:hypothetical protein
MRRFVAVTNLVLALAASATFLAPATAAEREAGIHEQVVPVMELKLPTTIEKGNDAIVIARGLFPNGCYKLIDPRVRHLSNREHEIEMVANVYEGFCIMSLIPFSQRVHLGFLERGEHLIRVFNGDGTYFEKEMVIR